jgi:peptidylprolyl isomerase
MSTKALLLTLVAGMCASVAAAQNQPQPQTPPPAAAKPIMATPTPPTPPAAAKPITFTDEEFGTVARMLTGAWKGTVPGAGEVVMGVAPVAISGLNDCLYSELARVDSMHRPFRQAIWQLHRENGKVRIKTLEFRAAKGQAPHVAGLWAAPEVFPAMTMDDLVATMDMELTKDGAGYKGKTPHPYPSSIGGASEMTGELSISADAFTVADRGFANGKQVWGPADGQGYTFNHFDGGPTMRRLDGGVVVIDYPSQTQGNPAAPGNRVSMEYIGYLDNGKMFDASYERGSPFTFTKGDKTLLDTWARAMDDARKGQVRRVIIPAQSGVGSAYTSKVPASAKMIYDVKVLDVVAVATPVAPPVLSPVDMKNPNDPNAPSPAAMKKIQEDMARRAEAKRLAEAEKARQEAEKAGKPAEPAPKK